MNEPSDKSYDESLTVALTDPDEAAACIDAVTVTAKQDISERLLGEAYQVIAALAIDCGRFDDRHVINALDNLAELRSVHDDVLPFPSKACSRLDRILTITPDAAFVVPAPVASSAATLPGSSLLGPKPRIAPTQPLHGGSESKTGQKPKPLTR